MSSCSFKDYFQPAWESGTSCVALEVALCRLLTSKTARKADFSELHTRLILPGLLFSWGCCNAWICLPNKPQTAVIWVGLTFLTAYSKDQVEQVHTSPCKSKQFGNQILISAWNSLSWKWEVLNRTSHNLVTAPWAAVEDKGCSHSTAHWGGEKPNTFPGSFLHISLHAQGPVIKGVNHYRSEKLPRGSPSIAFLVWRHHLRLPGWTGLTAHGRVTDPSLKSRDNLSPSRAGAQREQWQW